MGRPPDDPRLERVTAICAALPDAIREGMDRHVAFLVRGRKFVYFLNDRHGDGIVAMSCRVTPGEQQVLLGSNEPRFFKPAYLGSRGCIGLRLDLDTIDWDEAADFITESYWLVAPTPRSRKS
jgi:hypothetical protein